MLFDIKPSGLFMLIPPWLIESIASILIPKSQANCIDSRFTGPLGGSIG